MADRRAVQRPRVMVTAMTTAVAAVVLGATVLGACGGGDDDTASGRPPGGGSAPVVDTGDRSGNLATAGSTDGSADGSTGGSTGGGATGPTTTTASGGATSGTAGGAPGGPAGGPRANQPPATQPDITDLAGDCLDAALQFSEAFGQVDTSDPASYGAVADVFDSLADTFPAIADDVRTLATAYRGVTADDFSSLDSDAVAEAADHINTYFDQDCGG
jgi:hypothetical protein